MSNESERDFRPVEEGRNGPSPFLIGVIVVAVVCLVFVVQNSERTQIQFVFFEFNTRVWVAIAVAIALGAVLDRLVSAWWRRARRDRD